MKKTRLLFIIDDIIANRLLELKDEYISYHVLHEESFHSHLIDMLKLPIAGTLSDQVLQRRYLVIRSWQEIKELLQELQIDTNIYAWKKLFPQQLYTEHAHEMGYLTEGLCNASLSLIRSSQEQKYVMFYC